MPFFQAMAKRANAKLTREQLEGVDRALFEQPGSLVSGLRELEIVADDDEAAFLEAFPSGLKEAARALLHDNLNAEGGPLDVTVAWSPAYEDELSLFQIADNERTEGGITMLVKSRYPGDRSVPGTGIK
jgi:hypothetical protein